MVGGREGAVHADAAADATAGAVDSSFGVTFSSFLTTSGFVSTMQAQVAGCTTPPPLDPLPPLTVVGEQEADADEVLDDDDDEAAGEEDSKI